MSCNTWPIIVGGCHRSGTSMIRRILNANSRIHCGPEVKFFRDFYGDYIDDPIHHLRFATTARTLLPESELLEVLGAAFVAAHQRAAARAGKVRWADKNPENVLYLPEWRRILGTRWVFIQVVRNPLDTLASMKEQSFPHSLPVTLDERIDFYRKYTEAGLRFGESHPNQYYCVIYEDLVRNPDKVLQTMMASLDEAFEPGQLEFNQFTHQTGLEDPNVATTSHIHSRSVGRWFGAFSCDEARLIWRKTRDLWNQVDRENRFPPHSLEQTL
jgi:hypothetical protein